MSLSVYLYVKATSAVKVPLSSGIFIREDGQNVELSIEEWNKRFPDRAVQPLPRDVEAYTDQVYSANITHNLGRMAGEAGIYECLWRPEEIKITKAGQLIKLLKEGLAKMKADPAKYQAFNASNGWGLYENFVPWVEKYLAACEEYPDAEVTVSR